MSTAPVETPAPPNGAAKGGSAENPAPDATPAPAGGGFKAWLPLVVTIVAMPALAYAMTAFVLVPKMKKAIGAPAAVESGGSAEGKNGEDATGETAKGEHSKGDPSAGEGGHGKGGKMTFPFGKVLVNVSGSLGSRYLLTTFTLVGSAADFKTKIENNKDQLLDLASSTLGTKTITDLEKPGARNLIRSELISVFNNALGKGVVQEIYFTEFAIQ